MMACAASAILRGDDVGEAAHVRVAFLYCLTASLPQPTSCLFRRPTHEASNLHLLHSWIHSATFLRTSVQVVHSQRSRSNPRVNLPVQFFMNSTGSVPQSPSVLRGDINHVIPVRIVNSDLA